MTDFFPDFYDGDPEQESNVGAQLSRQSRQADVDLIPEAAAIMALLRQGKPMSHEAIATALNYDVPFTIKTVRLLYEAERVEDNGTRAETAKYQQAIEWRSKP